MIVVAGAVHAGIGITGRGGSAVHVWDPEGVFRQNQHYRGPYSAQAARSGTTDEQGDDQ